MTQLFGVMLVIILTGLIVNGSIILMKKFLRYFDDKENE